MQTPGKANGRCPPYSRVCLVVWAWIFASQMLREVCVVFQYFGKRVFQTYHNALEHC